MKGLIDANDIQKNQSLINDINEWFLNKNNITVKSRIQNWIKYLSRILIMPMFTSDKSESGG